MTPQPIVTPILVDDSEWAVFRDFGDASSQVLWKVVGPQDVGNAHRLCYAILAATGGFADMPSVEPAAAGPVAKPKPTRSVTAAIREHLLGLALTEEEIWVAVKAEFNLTNDKKYRVREVKRELIKEGSIAGEMEPT